MLSVLIPVFNYNVGELVHEVHKQALEAKTPFEIVVLDDGSEEGIKKVNRGLGSLDFVVYNEEPVNLGRSKIRNKLGRIAKYDNLIFMDCDSGIPNSDYIQRYLNYIESYNVIYGGRLYDIKGVQEKFRLHWLYGIKREQISANKRSVAPNRSFQTNNFLIRKDLLLSIGFNENIKGYGHEDTLFGYELKKRDIAILHIDNPVIHLGLESSDEFLSKTREGIKNLRRIMRLNASENNLEGDITILSYYKKLQKIGLERPVQSLYNRYEHVLRRNLLGHKPSLFLFDMYKLGYLCTLDKEV